MRFVYVSDLLKKTVCSRLLVAFASRFNFTYIDTLHFSLRLCFDLLRDSPTGFRGWWITHHHDACVTRETNFSSACAISFLLLCRVITLVDKWKINCKAKLRKSINTESVIAILSPSYPPFSLHAHDNVANYCRRNCRIFTNLDGRGCARQRDGPRKKLSLLRCTYIYDAFYFRFISRWLHLVKAKKNVKANVKLYLLTIRHTHMSSKP